MRTGRSDKERSAWRGKFMPPPAPMEPGYNELRRLYLARLRPIVASSVHEIPPCPRFAFTWYERTRHRDPDGVHAGGAKLILDALVLGGLLSNDGARDVRGFDACFSYAAAEADEGCMVFATGIREVDEVWGLRVPFRLPDLNEMIAAARRDGMLTERTRQARRGQR